MSRLIFMHRELTRVGNLMQNASEVGYAPPVGRQLSKYFHVYWLQKKHRENVQEQGSCWDSLTFLFDNRMSSLC